MEDLEVFLSKLEEIKKDLKVDIELEKETIDHLNKVINSESEENNISNCTYDKNYIFFLKNQIDDSIIKIDRILKSLSEFEKMKKDLDKIKNNKLFE
jgi:predicted metalloenzyme YecM